MYFTLLKRIFIIKPFISFSTSFTYNDKSDTLFNSLYPRALVSLSLDTPATEFDLFMKPKLGSLEFP